MRAVPPLKVRRTSAAHRAGDLAPPTCVPATASDAVSVQPSQPTTTDASGAEGTSTAAFFSAVVSRRRARCAKRRLSVFLDARPPVIKLSVVPARSAGGTERSGRAVSPVPVERRAGYTQAARRPTLPTVGCVLVRAPLRTASKSTAAPNSAQRRGRGRAIAKVRRTRPTPTVSAPSQGLGLGHAHTCCLGAVSVGRATARGSAKQAAD